VNFDPENLRVEDVPAACWYVITRVAPPALALGAMWWGVTAGAFILGQ
jgi:hypothetical protein